MSGPETRNEETGGGELSAQDRRKFFRVCLGGMGVLTGGFTVAPVVTFLTPPTTLTAQGPVEVPLSELAEGQAIYREVRGIPIVIIPGSDEPAVFNASCSHLGCIVRWEHDTRTFFCPCHGAVFDSAGKPLKGPTNQPLTTVEFEVREEKIILG